MDNHTNPIPSSVCLSHLQHMVQAGVAPFPGAPAGYAAAPGPAAAAAAGAPTAAESLSLAVTAAAIKTEPGMQLKATAESAAAGNGSTGATGATPASVAVSTSVADGVAVNAPLYIQQKVSLPSQLLH